MIPSSKFKPYYGKDVKASEYVRVKLPNFNKPVWAHLSGKLEGISDKGVVSMKRATVHILGHGTQPYVDVSTLSDEAKKLLMVHFITYLRIT
jgi:hypothetical protein